VPAGVASQKLEARVRRGTCHSGLMLLTSVEKRQVLA
jgi:hypothetical protein